MAKGITRTLQTTEIMVAKFEDGTLLPLDSIIEDGAVEHEVAVKIANRKYKNEGQVIVTDVIVSEPVKYRISLEDFIKHAEVIGSYEVDADEMEEIEQPVL